VTESWTREFARQYESYDKADRERIDALLDDILQSHTSSKMRHSLRRVTGASIWSTRPIRISRTSIRVAWTYANATRDAIVMVAIGEIPAGLFMEW
jgi:hypothetical protein